MKVWKSVYLSLLAVLLLAADSYAKISSIGDIERGSTSFAEELINLLAGPWGLIWAVIMIVVAFVESKTLEARWIVIMTVIIGLFPFLFAAFLKYIYL